MKAILSTICVFSLFLGGCATILNEDNQQVNISANQDITGTIDGIPFRAPGPVPIKRARSPKMILVDNPNCSNQVSLTTSVDPVVFINIISGGFFGFTTDFATEKMWKYQDQVVIPCK